MYANLGTYGTAEKRMTCDGPLPFSSCAIEQKRPLKHFVKYYNQNSQALSILQQRSFTSLNVFNECLEEPSNFPFVRL